MNTPKSFKPYQLYINDLSFTKIYLVKLKSEAPHTLSAFIHDVGIPHSIHSDDAPELMHGKFHALCQDYSIPTTYTEPHSPWQNRAEGGIRELKWHVHRKVKANNVPQCLWDFCCKLSHDICNKTSSNHYHLEDRTPFEALTAKLLAYHHSLTLTSISQFGTMTKLPCFLNQSVI